MRIATILLVTSLSCYRAVGQIHDTAGFARLITDTSLNSRLAKAKLKSEFDLPMVADGFWFFMDQNDYKEFVGKEDPTTFFDTLQTLTNVVCDCMVQKDTVYLQGGIGYEGAIGFDLRIVGNLFSGKIMLAGKGYRTNTSQPFTDEILLKSVRQKLKIQSLDSLRLDKKMIGELMLESENYFEKGSQSPNKLYMKVLFGCKLDEVIVL